MNVDTDEMVLRRQLADLADFARTSPRTLPSSGATQGAVPSWGWSRGERPRRRLVLAGATTGLVVLAAVATVWALRPDNTPTLISPATEPSTAEAVIVHTTGPDVVATVEVTEVSAALEVIPEPPLAERAAAAIASLDDRLLVWGGSVPNHLDGSEPPFSDGALFDRSGSAWRTIAPSPLPGGIASAVSVGDNFVVLNAGRVAVYSPADDTWAEVPPPVTEGLSQLTRLGDEIVVLPAAVAWNGSVWRQLAVPPAFGANPRTVSLTDSLITWGPIGGPSSGDAWRYDARTDEWTQLPASPLTQVYDGTGAVVAGDELIVVAWADMSAAALNLETLVWRELDRLPLSTVKCWVDATTIGATAIFSMCGDYALLDPTTSAWSIVPSPAITQFWPGTDLIPLGDDLVLGGRTIVPPSFWPVG